VTPLPTELTTPPVKKIYLVVMLPSVVRKIKKAVGRAV
jgi:hypothetical protein